MLILGPMILDQLASIEAAGSIPAAKVNIDTIRNHINELCRQATAATAETEAC
jgi:hypothetical protein